MDLPDELTLPLSSGADWWYWLGGRPAFDFVNTLRERWWRNVETLVSTSDLGEWLIRAELLDVPAPVSEHQLRSARRLREAIDVGIVANADSAVMPRPVIAEINRWLGRALPYPEIVEHAGMTTLHTRPSENAVDHALHLLARDAATALTAAGPPRARVCASQTCSARFFDASRAGTRRWCSMNACGNTAKARRHRARTTKGE